MEPHVLRYDITNSSRVDTFSAEQLPSGTWRLRLYVRFGAATPFHVVVYAHEPYADGKRRRDPEGKHCLLLSRVSEDVWRLESCQLHADSPRASFDLIQWHAPPGAA